MEERERERDGKIYWRNMSKRRGRIGSKRERDKSGNTTNVYKNTEN